MRTILRKLKSLRSKSPRWRHVSLPSASRIALLLFQCAIAVVLGYSVVGGWREPTAPPAAPQVTPPLSAIAAALPTLSFDGGDKSTRVNHLRVPTLQPQRGIIRHLESLADVERFHLDDGTSVRCVERGMQQKCFFRNIVLSRNTFAVYQSSGQKPQKKEIIDDDDDTTAFRKLRHLRGDDLPVATFPNPIFLPDGQNGPLIRYHQYRGHPIRVRTKEQSRFTTPRDNTNNAPTWPCDAVVTRPTVFVFRMSGHSTYHLWENNLGPFFQTLQDDFGFSAEADKSALREALNDPSQLLVAFADMKPSTGPKAPHLLDQLLQAFTNVPLINASSVHEQVCFTHAILGISASSFQHRPLLFRMMTNIAGYSPPPPLPEQPHCVYISRNHPKVVRGRKVVNENDVLPTLRAWIFNQTSKPLQVLHMEDYTYNDQVKLAMTTNIIFSPHGGGVANCIWMREGSVMIEFVAPVGKTLPAMYHSMCSKSGVTHKHFLADPDPQDANITDNPRLFSNMVMPVSRMLDIARTAVKVYHDNRAAQMKKNAAQQQQQKRPQ